MYHPETPTIVRRRAFSEVNQPMDISSASTITMTRIQSDTDLSRINRNKTFEGSDALFDSGNILARVVSALGSIRPSDEEDGQSVLEMATILGGGRHGFSDSQILSSERSWSHWSLAQSDNSNPPLNMRQRARAASVFHTAPSHENYIEKSAEWTWSGNNNNPQIQQFLNKTSRQKAKISKSNRNRSISIQIPEAHGREPDSLGAHAINNTLLQRINPFKKRAASIAAAMGKRFSISAGPTAADPQSYIERTIRGRESRISLPKQYLAATERRRPSVFSILSTTDATHTDVLETTTVADLIRAIELVHTKAQNSGQHSTEGPLLDDLLDGPKRKMGTAGITPTTKDSSSSSPFLFPVINNTARRSSLRPPSMPKHFQLPRGNMSRRQSSFVVADDDVIQRSTSIRPVASTNHPPPPSYYATKQQLQMDATQKQFTRRFSVRPTKLSIPPGQAPPASSSTTSSALTGISSTMLQRRLSLRPSPLARSIATQQSGRFQRLQKEQPQSKQQQQASGSVNRLQVPGVSVSPPTAAVSAKNPLWRATQLHVPRTRHGSLSELYQKNERKRTESK